jgi:hypothetical protein
MKLAHRCRVEPSYSRKQLESAQALLGNPQA